MLIGKTLALFVAFVCGFGLSSMPAALSVDAGHCPGCEPIMDRVTVSCPPPYLCQTVYEDGGSDKGTCDAVGPPMICVPVPDQGCFIRIRAVCDNPPCTWGGAFWVGGFAYPVPPPGAIPFSVACGAVVDVGRMDCGSLSQNTEIVDFLAVCNPTSVPPVLGIQRGKIGCGSCPGWVP